MLADLKARLFRRDEPGLLVAGTAHAGLLVAAVVGIASAPPSFADAQEALAVEVVSASQLAAMTRGEKTAKAVLPTPQPRVDRVAPVKEEKDPGEAKREAVAPPPPPRPEAAPEVRPEEVKAASAPPAPPVRPEPAKPEVSKPEPPKAEPVKAEPPAPRPPLRPAAPEAPEPEAEPVRQAKAEAPKKVEPKEDPKPEPKRQAKVEPKPEPAKPEPAKPEPPKPEAKAEPKPQPPKADPVKEALKRDDILKALASAKEKAPEARPARPKTDGAETSFDSDAIRRKLLAGKEPGAATGSTGERVQRQASLGTATGSAPKLSVSDREALAGMLREQMERCWSLSGAQNPVIKPLVRVALLPDGSLGAQPVLTNAGGEPAFRAIAESGMRAIRQCAPYRIPAKFAASYDDWKQLNVRLDPSDLL